MILNKLDLTIDYVYEIHDTIFKLSEETGTNRKRIQVLPNLDLFHLDEGVYDIQSNGEIILGHYHYGFIMPLKSLSRNGCFVTSEVYESSYKGTISFRLHIKCGPADIKRGTKIAKMFVVDSEDYLIIP